MLFSRRYFEGQNVKFQSTSVAEHVVARAVQELFTSLTISDQHEPYGDEALGANRYMPLLRGHVLDWVEQYGLGEDVRFKTQDNE